MNMDILAPVLSCIAINLNIEVCSRVIIECGIAAERAKPNTTAVTIVTGKVVTVCYIAIAGCIASGSNIVCKVKCTIGVLRCTKGTI